MNKEAGMTVKEFIKSTGMTQKPWDSLDGFTDAPHPAYMEKAI